VYISTDELLYFSLPHASFWSILISVDLKIVLVVLPIYQRYKFHVLSIFECSYVCMQYYYEMKAEWGSATETSLSWKIVERAQKRGNLHRICGKKYRL